MKVSAPPMAARSRDRFAIAELRPLFYKSFQGSEIPFPPRGLLVQDELRFSNIRYGNIPIFSRLQIQVSFFPRNACEGVMISTRTGDFPG